MFVDTFTRLTSILLTCIALAACAAGSVSPTEPQVPFAAGHANVPEAHKARLLYVTNFSSNVVAVVDYPSGNRLQSLTGFTNPQGICADASDHNVFIANTGGENVLEYAYGASSPKATYLDAGEFPVECSIDPKTGNLAIADIFSPTTGLGAATICTKPTHCKTYVQPGGLLEAYSIAYVGNGDLYVGGQGSSGFQMVYLPAGGSVWKTVSSGAVSGTMQWDGKYLAVAQAQTSGSSFIYRCEALGTKLACDDRRVKLLEWNGAAFFIKYGDRGVVGVSNSTGAVLTWRYPAGGEPTKSMQLVSGTYSTWVGGAVLRKP